MTSARSNRFLIGLFVTALAVYVAYRFYLLRYRWFDPDEFQHLHTAWCTAQGMLIYRDFFDHHGPLLPWTLAPLLRFIEDPFMMLWVARGTLSLAWFGLLALIWQVLRPKRPWMESALAVLFLISCTLTAQSSLEIRTDTPAALCLLLAVFILRDTVDFRKSFLAGLSAGLGFLFTPKAAFAGIGIGLGILWSLYRPGKSEQREIFLAAVSYSAGALLPTVLVGLVTAGLNSWPEFFHHYFVYNITYTPELPTSQYLTAFVRENILLCFFAILGLAWHRSYPVLTWTTGLALAGIFFITSPHKQLYLLVAPFLAVFAALGVREVWNRLPKTYHAHRNAYGLIVLAGLAWPVYIQTTRFHPNTLQLDHIACVASHTMPGDKVFDEFMGTAFFRPHMDYYWFLPMEMHHLSPEERKARVLKSLADPECKAFVFLGPSTRLPQEGATLVGAHYEYAGCGTLYLRKKNKSRA